MGDDGTHGRTGAVRRQPGRARRPGGWGGPRPSRLVPVTAVALLLAAGPAGSGGGATASGGPTPSLLRLPVRIHLLSSRLRALDVSYTDRQARLLLDRSSEIWARADIVWELESIVREPVVRRAEDEVERVLAGRSSLTAGMLAALLPRDRMLRNGWNVFLVRSIPGPPAIYFGHLPALLTSEVDPSGAGDPGRILAHELGHSLGLPHVGCTRAGNLMAPACDSRDRTRLTEDQIREARRRGERWSPARS